MCPARLHSHKHNATLLLYALEIYLDVALQNVRRSIYYTGGARPSPQQAFSDYARHVLSMSRRIAAGTAFNPDRNAGASPCLRARRAPGRWRLLLKEPCAGN